MCKINKAISQHFIAAKNKISKKKNKETNIIYRVTASQMLPCTEIVTIKYLVDFIFFFVLLLIFGVYFQQIINGFIENPFLIEANKKYISSFDIVSRPWGRAL